MGVFIQVEIQKAEIPLPIAERIVSLCPVEIFTISEGQLGIQPDREDECTLCELCLNVASTGSLIIRKNYKKDEVLISRAGKE